MRSLPPHNNGFVAIRMIVIAGMIALSLCALGNRALGQGGALGQGASQAPAATAPQNPAAASPAAAQAPPVVQPAAAAAPVAAAAVAKQPAPVVRTYTQIPPDEAQQEAVAEAQKKQRLDIMRIRQAGNFQPGQQALFDTYYRTYALPRWTWASHWSQLPGCRAELRNELRAAKASAVHDYLASMALDVMTKLANNTDYHWATRYNAILMIGDLNSREALKATETAQPMPEALPVLVAAFNDANQIDAVKLGALIGIYRHAGLGSLPVDVRDNQVVPAMLALSQAKTEAGRSMEGHAWLRARAIEVLGKIKTFSDQNQVVLALAGILSERGASFISLTPRNSAASALGTVNYQGTAGLDPSQLTVGLGQFAADACSAELTKIEEEQEKKKLKEAKSKMGGMGMYGSGGSGSGMYGDMYGSDEGNEESSYEGSGSSSEGYEEMYGSGSMYGSGAVTRGAKEEKEDQTIRNRRSLKAHLNAVVLGLTGLEAKDRTSADERPGGVSILASGPPHKPFVDGVLKQVEVLIGLCDTKSEDLDMETLQTRLQEELAQLQTVLTQIPAAEASAAGGE